MVRCASLGFCSVRDRIAASARFARSGCGSIRSLFTPRASAIRSTSSGGGRVYPFRYRLRVRYRTPRNRERSASESLCARSSARSSGHAEREDLFGIDTTQVPFSWRLALIRSPRYFQARYFLSAESMFSSAMEKHRKLQSPRSREQMWPGGCFC